MDMMFRISKLSQNETLRLARFMSNNVKKNNGKRRFPISGVASASTTLLVTPQVHRRQHQFAMRENEHREAMRIFILSLQAAAHTFQNQSAAIALQKPVENPEMHAETKISDLKSIAKEVVNKSTNESLSRSSEESSAIDSSDATKLNLALQKAIRRVDRRTALRLFDTAIDKSITVDLKHAVDLFFLTSREDPIGAYNILRYCNTYPHFEWPRTAMYRNLCTSVKALDPVRTHFRDIQNFIGSLMLDLDAMDIEMKKEIYPKLVIALATQRSVQIGPYAGDVYEYMIKNNFEIRPGWLKKLLTLSKYNRQEDLPFDSVLAMLVEMDQDPHPLHTMQAIHNMFPYSNASKMEAALGAVLAMVKRSRSSNNPTRVDLYTHNFMDIATLEAISAGAAHAGSPTMITLIWDILEECGYEPTETIYENTIIAFASTDECLLQAFTALAEMKTEGFEVSRPLVRSFSRAIRSYKPLVKKALWMLTEHESTLLSLESLNVILSSFAERGDVLDVLDVLDIMRKYGVKPNADSYSFAVEVLGKDISRRNKEGDSVWVQRSIDTADSLLTKMEEHETPPSADVIRNYIELLCMANEVSTATAIVDDCLSKGNEHLINNKTIYRLASAHADVGNIETAKRLESMTSEVIPVLRRKIKSKEQRHLHMLRVNGRSDKNSKI